MTEIRNVAIIAHVDHGKTTLVDQIFKQCQLFENHKDPGELIMDTQDLEKERGITIMSKNAAVHYKNLKINIIDTPGHADFGGEVERVLNMADGVLLLVDAFEGPMPQTRFVLQKSLQLGLHPIVVINKIDKPNCRPDEVVEEVFDLMAELEATENQLDFPAIYGSAKEGWMAENWEQPTEDVSPLLEKIKKEIPPPQVEEGPVQLLISSMDYSEYIGQIAIGRLNRGTLKEKQKVALVKKEDEITKSTIKELYVFEGMERKRVKEVEAGDICAIMGLENFEIGDTVTDPDHPTPLSTISVDEPTMSMLFTVNDSPFFGKEGEYVTSRHLKNRLEKELEKN